ncbi:acyltransferase family protein [Mucilaginibacter glaciei]|uniref:Acyltransferase n=1 Tax=Mucilaginibacter glaciei TaxID=2772109 RepID=A0A926NVU6_9SPHI|nr:acyltransferase [Mucilaginibacter glaciei]MBD1392659.1 acyltransferase [Mucilaginibacter glaciei]
MNFLTTTYQKLLADIKTPSPALLGGHYPALDGLRGVAILFVLLAHVGLNRYLWHMGFYLQSATGVHIFFVISGFLITTLLLKEKLASGGVSLRRFYMRRALRILPVAYLFLVVLIILNQVYQLKIAPADFIASFLFYKNLPMPNEPYTAHFWSLAVEQQFYLTFPAVLAFNTNRYLVLSMSIVVIVPAVCILSYLGLSALNDNSYGLLLSKLCMYAFWKGPVIILIGSVMALLVFKGIVSPEKIRGGFFLSFILLLSAIAIQYPRFLLYSKYTSEFLSAIMIAMVITFTINRKDFLSLILSSKLLRRIGVLSYSIYIWQELFIGLVAWQPWLVTFRALPIWTLMMVKLLAIIIIAIASYRFESLFLRLKSRYRFTRAIE